MTSHADSEAIDRLKAASEGLFCVSESEYPFEVFRWPGLGQEPLTAEQLLQQTGHAADTAVEKVSLERFFRVATREQDWHGPEEREEVKRYRNLVQVLETCLKNIQVYRVGKVELDVYIVGETVSGNLAGLSTQVVET